MSEHRRRLLMSYKETSYVPKDITYIDNTELSSDPATKIWGEPTASSYNIEYVRNNSHLYCAQSFTNDTLTIKQLSDTDINYYADGTSAATDITTNDVFMKMPDFWWKCEEETVGSDIWKITVSVTEQSGWNKWDGNKLIGKYEAILKDIDDNVINPTSERAFSTGDKIYSISGNTPMVLYNHDNFKRAARAKGNGYSLVDYDAHRMMCLLFYIWYGNSDCQSICGSGTSTYPKACGQTNTLGMTDTDKTLGDTQSINYWGLENWWGDIDEFIDNFITANSTGLINELDYNGIIKRTIQTGGLGAFELKQMVFGTNGDVVQKSMTNNGNYNTYYCDTNAIAGNANYIARRSNVSALLNGGVSSLELNTKSTRSGSSSGSRLLYYGNINII